MKVAKKFKDSGNLVFFGVSNSNDFGQELQEYGMAAAGDKPVVAARDARDRKFVMSDEFSYVLTSSSFEQK